MRFNNKGLTLIELLLVIALIGIISIIAIPQIKSYAYDLDSDSKKLYMDICYIRTMAMTEGEDYKIKLSDGFYEVLNGNKLIRKELFSKNCDIESDIGNKTIKFRHTGLLDTKLNTKNKVIKLVNKKNNKYKKIVIVSYTGKILLENEV